MIKCVISNIWLGIAQEIPAITQDCAWLWEHSLAWDATSWDRTQDHVPLPKDVQQWGCSFRDGNLPFCFRYHAIAMIESNQIRSARVQNYTK